MTWLCESNPGKLPACQTPRFNVVVDTRLLILNSDPVFEDRALAIFSMMDSVDLRIVRTLPEAVQLLLDENFDVFVVEGETILALEQATSARQHFPSLKIACLTPEKSDAKTVERAAQQNIQTIGTYQRLIALDQELKRLVHSAERSSEAPTDGIDPCHSLIGNLNQFTAAEILQMSCLGQRSGRFTFKSGRGSAELYLQHGSVRHAVFGALEGESAVAEVFRWRQGRFYFEEGIISQVQSVDRPWAHLLIDNLQKLDETLELASTETQR